MCDLAYVMLLEKKERQMLADRQGLVARGVTEGLPSFGTAQKDLDEALAAEPAVPGAGLSLEEFELRQVLGVLK